MRGSRPVTSTEDGFCGVELAQARVHFADDRGTRGLAALG